VGQDLYTLSTSVYTMPWLSVLCHLALHQLHSFYSVFVFWRVRVEMRGELDKK